MLYLGVHLEDAAIWNAATVWCQQIWAFQLGVGVSSQNAACVAAICNVVLWIRGHHRTGIAIKEAA